MATTTATTPATPFVEGLIDEILTELPFSVRIDFLLNWAAIFSTEGYVSDPAIVEMIGAITTLDFSGSQKINEQTFPNLIKYLPFTSSLAHLDLSRTQIGSSQTCIDTLAHPNLQHLVSLNLQNTKLKTIDPLLNAQHAFPKLYALNLSGNWNLSVPTISAATTQFPNLKVLDLSMVRFSFAIFRAFCDITEPPAQSLPSQPTPTANIAPFQLEKLFLSGVRRSAPSPQTDNAHFLARSPRLSQLKELYLKDSWLNCDDITQLFHSSDSLLKNLTALSIGLETRYDDGFKPLSAVAKSPLLSNLVKLELLCTTTCMNPRYGEEAYYQPIQEFIDSPFLWNPQLKHLSLHIMPPTFSFDYIIPALDAANVKLETLDLGDRKSFDGFGMATFAPSKTQSSLNALATASCLSMGLKQIKMGKCSILNQQNVFETQSPLLSHLEIFPHQIIHDLTSDQLVSILSSPNMSNDLIEFDLSQSLSPVKDVVKTLCTQRIIPGDETSPLKFGKLRKLNLSYTDVDDDDVELIVANLTQLTHLELVKWSGIPITDKTITALLSTELNNPCYPYTSLPNLIHLSINGSRITDKGWIQLSQSQLLDQLKYLSVNQEGPRLREILQQMLNGEILELPPRFKCLFTTSLVSNLRTMNSDYLSPFELSDLKKKDATLFQYLDHCHLYGY
jgi:hypothetical protein